MAQKDPPTDEALSHRLFEILRQADMAVRGCVPPPSAQDLPSSRRSSDPPLFSSR